MAVTRLQRKERKLKTRAKKRQEAIKRLNKKPAIKNVDIEALKKSFGTTDSTKTKAEKSPAPVAEENSTKKAEDKATEKNVDADAEKEA